MSKRYDALGVSASKTEVHEAIKGLDKGLFSNAFCKILPDSTAGDPDFCNVIHADTAGTKTNLAYLYWKETGRMDLWKKLAQDALVMNIDDLICVGACSPIIISSTIGRNKHRIPGEVIKGIIQGTEEILESFRSFGLNIISGGGETADVGDVVRTIDVGITAFSRLKKSDVVQIDIQHGDCIIGFSSFGKTNYESEYNSGIGSNGLTAARHDLLSKYYLENFPETVAPETNTDFAYTGQFRLIDKIEFNADVFEIGQLLTSPTRTYAPVIHQMLHIEKLIPHAIIHCTGGAQTKVKKFIHNKKIIKSDLFSPPAVFDLLSKYSLCSKEELYEVYNMGHRMEIYCNESMASKIMAIAHDFGLESKIIGRVEESSTEQVELHTPWGIFQY